MIINHNPYANILARGGSSPHIMRTYQLAQPIETHYRPATCQEVNCPSYAGGWRMGFDLTDDERLSAARWIRSHSGRTFTYELIDNPPEHRVIFTFPAGQQCFQTHRVPLDRDPFMIVRGGSLGRWTGERRTFTHPESFLDSWASDLDGLHDVQQRG